MTRHQHDGTFSSDAEAPREETERREAVEEAKGSENEDTKTGGRRVKREGGVTRPVVFQPGHALKFGLEVVARDETTGQVTAALCLFCKHYGREPKVGAKRRATTNFKYFKGVFRTDQYMQHHRLQHPIKWAEYEAASVREKQAFFPRYYIMSGEGMEAVATRRIPEVKKARKKESEGDSLGETTSTGLVSDEQTQVGGCSNNIFVEVPATVARLFSVSETTQWRPRHLNTRVRSGQGESTKPHEAEDQLITCVEVPDRLVFDIVLDLCAAGLSSAQITRSMHAMAKYISHEAPIASVWDELVDDYIEVATLGGVSMLSKLVTGSWACSIGFHARDNNSVNVWLRFHNSKLVNFHLLTLSLTEGSSSLPRVLGSVNPRWKAALLNISIDGDIHDASRLAPLIAHLCSNQSAPTVTWSGDVLLEYALSELFDQLMQGSFARTFNDLKAVIKSDAVLLQEIGHEGSAPTSGNTRVNEIIAIAKWMTESRVRIRRFLKERDSNPTCEPNEPWWLALSVFDWIASAIRSKLSKIRTPQSSLQLANHVNLVMELACDVSSAFRLPCAESSTSQNDVIYQSRQGTQATTKTGMLEFIIELGSFVNSLLSSFQDGELDAVLRDLGTAVATLVETLQTKADDALKLLVPGIGSGSLASPPVLPHEFAKMSGKEFSALLAKYRHALQATFSDEDLDVMEQELQALKRANREKDFRQWGVEPQQEDLKYAALFDTIWAKTMGRFRLLHAFAGGLATIYPSDSRRSNHELKPLQAPYSAVMSVEAEAPFYAAQFHRLHSLLSS